MEDGTKSYSNAKRYFLQPQNTNVSNENKKTLQHEKVKRKKKKEGGWIDLFLNVEYARTLQPM